MALKPHTAPTVPCVTLAEAKVQVHADPTVTDEDALITAMVAAATDDAEHLMQRAVMPQKWLLTLDAFVEETASPKVIAWQPWSPMVVPSADCILLRRPIVTSIDSIQYAAADTGTMTTLPATEYQVDLASELIARVAPAYGKTWPATRLQLGAVQIVFSCGWPNAAAVPSVIKQWIQMRMAAYFENRETWTLGKRVEQNEFLDRMLDRYRIFTI